MENGRIFNLIIEGNKIVDHADQISGQNREREKQKVKEFNLNLHALREKKQETERDRMRLNGRARREIYKHLERQIPSVKYKLKSSSELK